MQPERGAERAVLEPPDDQLAELRVFAWSLSTGLGRNVADRMIGRVLKGAGVRPVVASAPPGLEAVRRHGDGGRSWLFGLNHTGRPCAVPASGTELLSGRPVTGPLEVAGSRVSGPLEVAHGAVAMIREDGASSA